jgi:hypothetical protein
MAKRAPKETSTPLVVALVFFVLTTIAFGVMWYMQYSDQQAKDEEVKKAKSAEQAAKTQEGEALLKLRVNRVFAGTDEDGDKSAIEALTSGKDKAGAELKRIREVLAKQFNGQIPAEMDIWNVDEKGLPTGAPKAGLASVAGEQARARKAAEDEAAKERGKSKDAIAQLDKLAETYKKATEEFNSLNVSLPKDFKSKLDDIRSKSDERMKAFAAEQKKSRDEVVQIEDAKNKAERKLTKAEQDLKAALEDARTDSAKQAGKTDVFQFDEPQGKVLRRLPEGIIEIDIGSTARVKEGLTFTVLPSDFPEKGKQSRIRTFRVPDERGMYRNVERFVEKGTIEVIQVLGPQLSRARITSEADYIRDGISNGDLLYNAVWRKGAADHIALVGIFDTNGDGTDDIVKVIRDLQGMGVIVDAYFDLAKRQWVGAMNEQTRYLVVGRYPVQSATDPNRDEKTKLIDAMSQAVEAARLKNAQIVNFRDFFPRTGYRVKLDVPDEKINQATAPYLKGVTASDAPPPGGN